MKKQKRVMMSLSQDVMEKIEKMSKILTMTKTSCVNLAVTKWLKQNEEDK